MCNRCYQLKGQDRTGLDWIGFTIGYLSCHCSKDCPMAPFSLTRPCASRSVVVLSKENPLQGYQWCETLNSNLIEKHCQRHNWPKAWVHLAKVTSWGHITSSNTNLDHISSSESRLSINKNLNQASASPQNLKFKILTKPSFRISTKIQHNNLYKTSAAKYWTNSSFIILPELQLQNLDQPLCSKSEQKFSFRTKRELPNLQQTVANTILIINISNSNNLNKF